MRARDAELVVRQQNKQRARFRFHVHRFSHDEKFSRFFLGAHTGFPDKIDIGLRAAVANWRFICVHLHNGVVHAHRPERGQHVLDCVHADGTFADGRGAFDCLQILDPRVDGWLVLQILASEFNSVIRRGGMKFQGDLFTCVQCGAAKASGLGNGMLKLGSGRH